MHLFAGTNNVLPSLPLPKQYLYQCTPREQAPIRCCCCYQRSRTLPRGTAPGRIRPRRRHIRRRTTGRPHSHTGRRETAKSCFLLLLLLLRSLSQSRQGSTSPVIPGKVLGLMRFFGDYSFISHKCTGSYEACLFFLFRMCRF